jgi:hypothetical protein
VSILALGLGAIAGLALVEVVVRRTDAGAMLALALLVLLESGLGSGLSFAVGSMRVGLTDLLFVVLTTAAVARLLRLHRLDVRHRLGILLGALVIWSVIRGAGPYGAPAAINEARKYLVFVGTVLYFATMQPRRDLLDRIGWIWIAAGAALTVLTLVRWIANAAGVTGGVFGSGSSLRVVPAADALIVAQAAIIAFPLLGDRRRGVFRYLGPMMLVAVILLQHRTVWVAVAAGIVYLLFRERSVATPVLAGLGVAVVLFGALVFTVFGDRYDVVAEQLSGSAQATNTFEWRVEGWIALLEESGPEGPAELATGRPFGGGWDRVVEDGRLVTVSPHNFYVESYLRVGLIGIVGMVGLYVLALRGTGTGKGRVTSSRPSSDAPLLMSSTLHTVIVMQLLFYITYSPDVSQALLLGVGLAVAGSLTDRTSRAPTPMDAEVAT